MNRILRTFALLGVAMLAEPAMMLADLASTPAEAQVYCRRVGVPRGCIVRPAGAVVVRPAPRAVVVRPAPRAVVVRPARRAVVRPGVRVNAGGPVNRVGIR